MTDVTERLRRWMMVSAETQALLRRNDELFEQRAELLRLARQEFREIVRLARDFTDAVSGGGKKLRQETGSTSLRSR